MCAVLWSHFAAAGRFLLNGGGAKAFAPPPPTKITEGGEDAKRVFNTSRNCPSSHEKKKIAESPLLHEPKKRRAQLHRNSNQDMQK